MKEKVIKTALYKDVHILMSIQVISSKIVKALSKIIFRFKMAALTFL